jgi:putative ABC transport system permease protein
MVVALGLTSALMPYFNEIAGKQLSLDQLIQPEILFSILLIILIIGLLAGTYPAFYLTSFQVTETLKGKVRSGMKSGKVRSFLVTFQFWISILLVICTGIVYQQITFMRDRSLGFDKEKVLMIENMDRLGESKLSFKNELMDLTSIESTSFSNNRLPGTNNTTIFREEGQDVDHIMGTYFVDKDYLKTLGLQMSEGRFFSEEFPTDTMAVILNEAAVKELNWADPLSNQLIDFGTGAPVAMRVIGVIKDFNFESIKINVRPLVLRLTPEDNIFYVRYSEGKAAEVVADIEEKWNILSEGEPIEYAFMDQQFNDLFRAEQQLGKIFTIFTALAIAIACLGLFGLASFMAEQRRKEIGVRKVLGASVWSIIGSMSYDFMKLVVIAFALAIFPAWYVMNEWLSGFSSRIEMGVWIFLLGGILAIAVAWITVSFQSYQAAKSNPVYSLKYE